jgi:hypothetical protein
VVEEEEVVNFKDHWSNTSRPDMQAGPAGRMPSLQPKVLGPGKQHYRFKPSRAGRLQDAFTAAKSFVS